MNERRQIQVDSVLEVAEKNPKTNYDRLQFGIFAEFLLFET